MSEKPVLSFVGGTGPEGLGLAMRFAHAGHQVIVGSRRKDRAEEGAAKISSRVPGAKVKGMENQEAVVAGSVVFITVPFDAQRETLEGLKDAFDSKIAVSTVVPMKFEKGKISAVLVEEGSAAQQAQKILAKARVVAAFQNLSAKELADVEHEVPSDVVACSDDLEAKKLVIGLASCIKGVRGIDGGGLANARYVEDITVLLLNINKVYKTQSSIKIVGV